MSVFLPSLLYIGSLHTNSNSFRRFQQLKNCCSNVDAVDTDPFVFKKYFTRIQHHFGIGPGLQQLNKKIKQVVSDKKFDIVFVDNKTLLTAFTLHHIKKTLPDSKIVNLITDDPFGQYSKSWKQLKSTATLFDCFFVQRIENIQELKKIGAVKVEICYRSFDPSYNRPLTLNESDIQKFKVDVGFVGTYEKERAMFIAYAIQNGIDIYVTGNGWPNAEYWDVIKPFYKGPSKYGEDYIKTINGMNIALHFLRKANRDEQDSRTFEIPACKVFMLAERSNLHEELFEENKEAVYFSTKEELVEKIKYYKEQPEERKSIAENGYKRCFTSGYTHLERMKDVIKKIYN